MFCLIRNEEIEQPRVDSQVVFIIVIPTVSVVGKDEQFYLAKCDVHLLCIAADQGDNIVQHYQPLHLCPLGCIGHDASSSRKMPKRGAASNV